MAFLDSDVVPRRGWLEALLGHFCDPAVALVAPRIVGMSDEGNLVARYEAIRSSLDLGGCEAPVVPYGKVAYVPSAAIICRCSTLRELDGFDEALQSGEDVDLCWRLVDAGSRLRYEPIAQVAHDHRIDLRNWVARKAFYGGSAAPLSARHPGKTAPMVISGWALAGWALMALGSALGYLVSLLLAAFTGRRVARSMRGPDTAPADVVAVTLRALAAAGLQIASALCRHYWPVALLAACVSQRCRTSCWWPPSSTGWWTGCGTRGVKTMPSRWGCRPTYCSSGSTTWPTAPACGAAYCANATLPPSDRRSAVRVP